MRTTLAILGALHLCTAPLAAHPGHHANLLGSGQGWMHYLTQPDHAGTLLLGAGALVASVWVVDRVRALLG
jgi:hypothetical protein